MSAAARAMRRRPAMRNRPWWIARTLVAGVLLAGLSACATFSERIATVDRRLAAGDFEGAAAALDGIDFAPRDEALLRLNRGMIARYRGDHAASNADLEIAKQLMEQFAALSVRELALASSVTEQAGAYAGQPFERLLLPAFKAINYLDLGDPDAARVEALQIDLLLREFGEGQAETAIAGAAFARYVAGLVFELGGERSDAYIAYRKAADNYRAASGGMPPVLAADLARLANALGRDDLPFGLPLAGADSDPDTAEVVVLVTAGLAPALREQAVMVPEPVSGRWLRIALPTLVPRAGSIAGITIHASGHGEGGVEIADLFRIAKADLDARLPGMTARLLARQVVKSQLVRQASRSAMNRASDNAERVGAGLLAIGAELTALLTERADTRQWLALPGSVHLARLSLPPGRHELSVVFRGLYNESGGSRRLPPVELRAGERRFVSLHRAD